MKKRIISMALALALAISMLPPSAMTAVAREREIVAVNSGNSLNMYVDANGTLRWNAVSGATGYTVMLTKPNITKLHSWDVTNNYLNLTIEMDGLKFDSGQYTLVVSAKGVSGEDSMLYYYTSHVDKLESPNNLMWIGDKAVWDAVPGATSYKVTLYNFDGAVFTVPTTGCLYDFSGNSPQDGWTFQVQALSNGTSSAPRYSDYVESPAKGSRTRTLKAVNSGNGYNMRVDTSGTLWWDAVPGTTGYTVMLTQPNVSQLHSWQVSSTHLNLITEMDGLKFDSGNYILVVKPKGVSGDASMYYYYTSHVDQLESPNNLVWIGDKAAWDAVPGAISYNITLYNFEGAVVTIPTTECLYDFSGSSPQDGWTFQVQALSNGTWSAKRYSDYTESPGRDSRIPITEIKTTMSVDMVPKAGMEVEHFIPNVPDGEPYSRPWNGADWYDSEGVRIAPTVNHHYDRGYEFEAGRTYYADYLYTADDGYVFAQNPSINFMGPDPSMFTYEIIDRWENDRGITVRYTFTIPGEFDYPDINKVSMMYYGTAAEGYKMPEDCELIYNNCTITREEWNAGTWGSEANWGIYEEDGSNAPTFLAGERYVHMIELTAKDGYKFSAGLHVQKGMQDAEEYGIVSLSDDRTVATVKFTYDIGAYEIIDTVELVPANQHVDFMLHNGESIYLPQPFIAKYAFSADCPYETDGGSSYEWFDDESGKSLQLGYPHSFEVGKTYTLKFAVRIKDEFETTHKFAQGAKLVVSDYVYAKSDNVQFSISGSGQVVSVEVVFTAQFPAGAGTVNNPAICNNYTELKYALEHPTIQGILVNSFDHDSYQGFYTLEKEKDFEAGHCAITIPANATKYLTINADINIRVPYVDYLLYSFIDNRGSLTVGGTGSLNVSMNARGYPSAIIFNNGKLNIGGSVTFDPTNQSFDSVHGYSVFTSNGHAVINSGTFFGFDASAVSYYGGRLDIYGGTFNVKNGDDQAFGLNTDSYLTTEEHNVNLYGGTFEGIRADQSTGADIAKLSNLLGYGAYYTYYSDGSTFNPSGKKDTHETLTVKMNNILRDIELTIDQPKQNGTPDQTVACGDYAYKQATGNDNMWDDVDVYWEESSDGKTWTKMASNATFTVGKHYRASINVMPRNGNIFDIDAQIEPNVVATVNGYYAEVLRYPEEDPSELICVRFDFGILNDNIIEQIDIDCVVEPVVGEYPSYSCTISGTGYTINTAYDNGTYAINGICWYDVTYDMWMRPNMTFQIGHAYKVFVDVKTEDGYEFYTTSVGSSYPPAGWGYINDNYATLGIQSDGRFEQSLSWTFTCQPKTIKSVAVSGLDVPTDGFTPDFDAITDSEYYTVESIEWMDYTNGTDMTETDTFVAGNEYWVLITVVPKEEDGNRLCQFVDDKTVATLNGIEVKDLPNDGWQEVQSAPRFVRIYYTFKSAASELGYFVSGTVTSGGSVLDDVTIQLIPDGQTEVAYETVVRGTNASYFIAGVVPGRYIVKVMKAGFDAREYTLTVVDQPVLMNLSLLDLGDADGNGSVTAEDAGLVKQYRAGLTESTALDLDACDVNGDGKVDAYDAYLIQLFAAGEIAKFPVEG